MIQRHDLDALASAVQGAQALVTQTAAALAAAQARLALLESGRILDRTGAILAALQAEVARLQQQLNAAQAQLQSTQAAFAAALDGLVDQLDPAVPLVLLPIRIETRFKANSAGQRELLIRVYPDDIHSDTHEPGLTSIEVSFGSQFWEVWWRAGAEPDRQTHAGDWQRWRQTVEAGWKQLTMRLGATRALWAAGQLRPTNMADRPAAPIPAPAPLPKPPVYPSPPLRGQAWSRPARASCLPDRFVAIGYRDNAEAFRVWGSLVPATLPIGPDPTESLAGATDPSTQLWYRWKTDFDAALSAGMAIRVDAALVPADGRIDRLLVLGVLGTGSAADSATEFAGLLAGHCYTWGLDIVPQGTPTNNTPDARSEYQRADAAPADTLDALLAGTPSADSDAAGLAAALGVPVDLFSTVASAGAADQADAQAMNTVAWSAWWAYYCRRLLGDVYGGSDVRETVLPRWRDHFQRFVRARGPLPAIRAGSQPYGLLPVSSLASWTVASSPADIFAIQIGSGRVAGRIGWDYTDAAGFDAWSAPAALAELGNGSGVQSAALSSSITAGTTDLFVLDLIPEVSRIAGSTTLAFRMARNIDQTGAAGGGWLKPVTTPAARGAGATYAAAIGSSQPGSTDLWVLTCMPTTANSTASLVVGRAINQDGQVSGGWAPAVNVPITLPASSRVLGMAVDHLDDPSRLDAIVLIASGAAGARPRFFLFVGKGVDNTGAAAGNWSAPLTAPALSAAPQDCAISIVRGPGKNVAIRIALADAGAGAAGASPLTIVSAAVTATAPAVAVNWGAPVKTTIPGLPSVALAAGALGGTTRPGIASEAGLVNILRTLRAAWLARAAGGSTLGVPTVADPDGAFLDLLTQDATAASVACRSIVGPQFASNLWRLLGTAVDQAAADRYTGWLAQQVTPTLASLGLPPSTWLARAAYAEEITEIAAPLAQSAPLSETDPLAVNYLAWLAGKDAAGYRDPEQVHTRAYLPELSIDPAAEPTLLKVARHALLNGYLDAALRRPVGGADVQRQRDLLGLTTEPNPAGGVSPNINAIDPELIGLTNLSQDATTGQGQTRWQYLTTKDPATQQPMSALLRSPGVDGELDTLRAAIERLATRPSAALERLLTESFDLASYRLDAWITSVVAGRLAEMRAARPTGAQLGAWGVVEHLSPSTQAQSTGFVHAPSLGHGAMAAVLRSAWLSHGGAQNPQNPFAVDLSSARVRSALDTLDGIRQGQPLGALLGYQIERALHENYPALELDKYIAPLRQRYPLVAGRLTPTAKDEAVESVAARNVVDGLGLLRAWETGQFDPGALANIAMAELGAVKAELSRLRDVLDAAGDLGVAESVYQAIHGRHSRTGASLDALSKGTTAPPPIEVADTPRTGVALKHRVLIAIDRAAPAAAAASRNWTAPSAAAGARQVRKAAEPALDQWIGAVLGNPGRVRWRVSYDGGAVVQARTLTSLGMSPIDIVYAAGGGAPEPQSDMDSVLSLDAARNAPAGSSKFQILVDRDPKWAATDLSLAEFFAAARSIRDLVAEATPAAGRHLAGIGEQATNWDLTELAGRAAIARTSLRAAADALRAFFAIDDATRNALKASATPPDSIPDQLSNLLDLPARMDLVPLVRQAGLLAGSLDPLRDALLGLWLFGLPGAAPLSATGNDAAAQALLVGQARRAGLEAERRLGAAATAAATAAAKSVPTADDYFAIFAEVFERSFRVLPRFTVPDQNALAQAFAARQQAGDAGNADALAWLDRVTRVRPRLGRLERAFTMAECLGGAVPLGLSVAQFPVAADSWIANSFAAGKGPAGGRVSVAIQHLAFPAAPDAATGLYGLVVDEWDETVPSASETTAVTVHYNAPGSEPPNAILVAAPPAPGRHWTIDLLAAVVRETMELAQVRTVDPDLAPPGYAHFLPVSVMALNAGDNGAGDTVATFFRLPG